MGRLLHMKDLVYGQGSRLAEPLATLVTLEGLLFGVDVTVISQVILSSECFATDITIEGSLIGVGPLVDQEVVRFGELPIAVLANETLLWPRSSSGTPQQSGIVVWWVYCRNSRCCRCCNSTTGCRRHTGSTKPMAHQEGKTVTWRKSHSCLHVSCSHGIGGHVREG